MSIVIYITILSLSIYIYIKFITRYDRWVCLENKVYPPKWHFNMDDYCRPWDFDGFWMILGHPNFRQTNII